MSQTYLRARQPLVAAFRPLQNPRHAARRRPLFPPGGPARSRPASTTTDSLAVSRLRAIFFTTALAGTLTTLYLYVTDTRAAIHGLVPPLLRLVFPDAEDAHHASVTALSALYAVGLHPRERDGTLASPATTGSDDLAVSVWGRRLANPIGISAGLDKDGDIPDALFALGPAVVEVGGCTPRPQAGNPRPRVWRVPALEGLVNRYGLNSCGADAMAVRLRRRGAIVRGGGGGDDDDDDGRLLLVQVAKAKETDERDVDAVAADYVYCVRRLAAFADVLVVNVSSPNTPGLRELQAVGPLTKILTAVVDEAGRAAAAAAGGRGRSAAPTIPRVMVKVSPDEDEDAQIEGICQAVWESGVDGVIVGNTTKRRTGLVPDGVRMSASEQKALMETGGFSGPEMFGRTLALVAKYRKALDEHELSSSAAAAAATAVRSSTTTTPAAASMGVPAVEGIMAAVAAPPPSRDQPEQKVIFATGGITNGQQALQILNAGASVAMVYTGLVYGGAGTITRIKEEMRRSVSGSTA